jgi:hypothetical protein
MAIIEGTSVGAETVNACSFRLRQSGLRELSKHKGGTWYEIGNQEQMPSFVPQQPESGSQNFYVLIVSHL